MRGRRGQSRPLCLGTEGGITRACAAPQAPPSLCTGGVQRPQGGPPLSGESLRNDEAANPAPQSEVLSARSPWCVCLSCCQLDTWFRNADEGGKQTEFSAHSGSAAHSPLQKDVPPHPPLASRWGPSVSPTSCQVATESLPNLCTHVGSSSWQVFQDSCSP